MPFAREEKLEMYVTRLFRLLASSLALAILWIRKTWYWWMLFSLLQLRLHWPICSTRGNKCYWFS